jgi:hypothetical protein
MDNKKKLALAKELWRRRKEKEYSQNYEIFAKEQIKIRPKDITKGLVPFEFNDAQKLIHDRIEEQLEKTGRVRAIVLKARQQGISTYCTGRVYWKTKYMPLSRSVVMAHDTATSDALFNMSKDVHANMDPEFQPEISKSNAKEIIFVDRKKNDRGEEYEEKRGYRLYTAGSPEAGRGTTPTIAHLSEVAFWQFDEKILAGLFQGIPDAPGTEAILESTANGINGEFYRLWKLAEKGLNEYIPIFIPWFMTKEYRKDNYPEEYEYTEEEEKYANTYGLDKAQMYWRKMKIGESGPAKFQQEYPATAEEAFISSGANVFDVEVLNKVILPPVIRQMRLDEGTGFWDKNPHGELFVYKNHKHDDKFLIAADVGMGIGQDYSVAIVMDPELDVVAVFRSNRIDPSQYGETLFYLGRLYNHALVAVESNSIGVATLARLKQMNYPNLYYQTNLQKLENEEGERPGFKTTSSSKPAIIGRLQNAVKNLELKINDEVLLQEMKEYVQFEGGKTGAMPGSHDDHVMAAAIAVEVHRTHANRLSARRAGYNLSDHIVTDDTPWL